MLRRPLGAVAVAAASAVVVPYAVALLSNILYGWPLGPRRYRRAFDPRKVFALNCSLLLQLTKLRFVGLMVRWKRFYQNATTERLIRDLEYGSNGNYLDVYFPSENQDPACLLTAAAGPNGLKPIVIFVYGGSWGSGDKDMYGLLCSQLADRLSAVVICPNYSTYPKGFVDDMVQDVSDVIAYAHKFACDFGADKDRIMLIGHSAGAHLAVMTVLELSMKLLSEKPELLSDEVDAGEKDAVRTQLRTDSLEVSIIDSSTVQSHSLTPLEMHEKHFNGDTNGQGALSGSTFCMINVGSHGDAGPNTDEAKRDAAEPSTDAAVVTESFYMINDNNSLSVGVGGDHAAPASTDVEAKPSEQLEQVPVVVESTVESDVAAELPSNESEAETTKVETEAAAAEAENETEELLASVKLVIGLAGVYDIASHYLHEMSLGYEDISTMARAMYGPNRFDRFSPTVVVQSLPKNAKLPPIHLVHGGNDRTVPVSSSTLFGDTVWKRGTSPITATIVNGCGHQDICLDLMEPQRYWHDAVFTEVACAFNRFMGPANNRL